MMPLKLRRKARTMEKVENLYRTARVQKAMPRHLDHVVEICDRNASSLRDGIGASDPDFKSLRGGSTSSPNDLGAIHRGTPTASEATQKDTPAWPVDRDDLAVSQPISGPARFWARYESFRRRIFPKIAPSAPVPR
jgi:hypothetical protein